MNDIIELTADLIAIRSTPDRPKELERALERALRELKGFTIERFERSGVKSALVYHGKTRPKRFKVVLNAHLDVIPGKDDQYVPRIAKGRVHGVGAMDMKGNAAAMIHAFKKIAKELAYPIALQLTTDEELGGFDGTKYQIERGVRADFVLAGEPTNFDIVHRAKGILWLEIAAKERTAHGAYPWRGTNAIMKMQRFLSSLAKAFPNPDVERWKTTVNVARIGTTNVAFNKIPDDCTVGLDIRHIPEKEHPLETVKRLIDKGFTMKVIADEPALLTEREDPFLRTLERAARSEIRKKVVLRGAQGSSDARHYRHVGSSGVEFGPIGKGIGSDDEWVDIASLERFARILERFLIDLK